MFILSILVALLIIALIMPEGLKKPASKVNLIVGIGVGLLLLLLVTGRLNILTAFGALILAFLSKLPQVLKWWSLWKNIKTSEFTRSYDNRGSFDKNENRNRATNPSRMSRKKALQVLGLQEGASHQEINLAYKRLMQKVHPDRGGSETLAAEVNEARDVLL